MSETKKCTKCGEIKLVTGFSRNGKQGLRSWCKACSSDCALAWQRANPDKTKASAARWRAKNSDQAKEWTKQWRAQNPEKARAQSQRRTARQYGLSLSDRADLLRLQQCRCVICYDLLRPGGTGHAIDHDHVTGKLRGILCANCNHGLGKFKDDPNRLREAAAYLERHKKA